MFVKFLPVIQKVLKRTWDNSHILYTYDIFISKLYEDHTSEKVSDSRFRNLLKGYKEDKELLSDATCKKFLLVRKEGNRDVKRKIDHYNLDMIISLGYRVQSESAVRFRIWATQRLHEYIQKGFSLDDDRLKQGGNRYFKELLQRIRDIRSSERNFYQQVTDIYATSIDYPTLITADYLLLPYKISYIMLFMNIPLLNLFLIE